MRISEVARILEAKIIYSPENDCEVSGGYCGDFLSVVMSKASANCIWFTIMNNINVAAVASLVEVGVVVLCDGVMPDEALTKKVLNQKIPLIVTKFPVYEAVKKLG
jgi:hypothetical protein